MSGQRHNLEIRQGETWTQVVRWYSETFGYAAIASVTKAAPAVITTDGNHGIPDEWRVAIVGCKGMTQLNAEVDDDGQPPETEYQPATVPTASTLSLNSVNSTNFGTYTGGGVVQFRQPVDMAAYTARLHFRDSVEATTTLLELTTENSGIAIDNTAKKITLTITAAQAAAITWESAVYDLELVSSTGVVTRLIEGAVTVTKEVTR